MVESTAKDSEPERVKGPSISQAQKVLVQFLSEMVEADFRLPLAASSSIKYSSLRSLHPTQGSLAFPFYPSLEEMCAKWDHSDRVFVSP